MMWLQFFSTRYLFVDIRWFMEILGLNSISRRHGRVMEASWCPQRMDSIWWKTRKSTLFTRSREATIPFSSWGEGNVAYKATAYRAKNGFPYINMRLFCQNFLTQTYYYFLSTGSCGNHYFPVLQFKRNNTCMLDFWLAITYSWNSLHVLVFAICCICWS